MSDARHAGPDGWGLEPKQSREEGGEGVEGKGRQGVISGVGWGEKGAGDRGAGTRE